MNIFGMSYLSTPVVRDHRATLGPAKNNNYVNSVSTQSGRSIGHTQGKRTGIGHAQGSVYLNPHDIPEAVRCEVSRCADFLCANFRVIEASVNCN
jgi:hypothetical protein